MRALAIVLLVSASICASAQTPQSSTTFTAAPSNHQVALSDKVSISDTVVLSGTSTTGRIADPNEKVVFSGYVMRVADFVEAVSSNTEEIQRLHTPEMHNHETGQPTEQPKGSGLN